MLNTRSWFIVIAIGLASLAKTSTSPAFEPTGGDQNGHLVGCEVPLDALKAHLGGYCRGPRKDRVIVFVNGVFGDAVDTWSSKTGYWPDLLARDPDFADADIYVHSFQSPYRAVAQ